MASVGSTTNTKSILRAKTGMGGLVSGMDIDTLVENLTSNSRQKITKQKQTLQKLDWKKTAYRTVSKSMKEFQSKYLDVLSSTNLKSTAFFNTSKVTSSSDKVSASSTTSASKGSVVIDSITQIATYENIASTVSASQSLTSSKTVSQIVAGLEAGESISLNLDGRVKTITFDSSFVSDVKATPALFESKLQTLIDNALGATSENRVVTVNAAGDPNVTDLTFSATGSKLTLNNVGEGSTTLEDIGFSAGQSNRISTGTKLGNLPLSVKPSGSIYTFMINGVNFSFNSEDTLASVMQKINSSKAGVTISYSSITDKFSMKANNSGAGENIKITEIGDGLMKAFGLSGVANPHIDYGVNAILSVNNQTITRSSNSFDLEGINVTLKGASENPVTLSVTEDYTSVTDTVKKFVEDYNTMIDYINGLTKEDIEKDYQPLTDEQKEEMSESEIASWEKKAKSGILRSDAILKSISAKLHSVMTGLSVNGTSLYTMGITSAGYGENGKLKLDETKLKTALETKGNDIKELFTSDNGISSKLDDIITGATKTTGVQGKRGTLIELAGYDSTRSDTENSIYEQTKKINKNISVMQNRLEDEETRLWRKFTAMEKAINSLNSQNSVLSSFSSKS